MSEFDLTYVMAKSVKGRVIAEHLAEHATNCKEKGEFPFPDESVMEITENRGRSISMGQLIKEGMV